MCTSYHPGAKSLLGKSLSADRGCVGGPSGATIRPRPFPAFHCMHPTSKPRQRARAAEPRLSRNRKPEGLPLVDWQVGLRRQFGSEQASFALEGQDSPACGEFTVHNPDSGRRYRVAIRGLQPGESFCACLDFATNDLGTCKHTEFTLARLLAQRGSRAALQRGFHPPARLDTLLRAARRAGHELRFYDDARAFAAEARDAQARRHALDEAYPQGPKSKALQRLLKTRLYPYRLEELISIVRFVDQHRLGPTWRLLHEHQQRDESGRVVGYTDLGRIGATLAPIMLRRRKSDVPAQLPERIDNTLFVPMTPQQLAHHQENGDIVARIVSRWRRTGFLSDADQRRLTCALQNMRMSCNSTYLLDRQSDHGLKADELMTVLDELLEQPDAKAVVFSQWVRTHELIVRRLPSRGWGHVLFHGGVPAEQRPALVDRFHQDPDCRVFLSTDAGGVGLNLQHAAAVVVNMDVPWNPAVLEQRIGRVHRMGQRRSVQVLNFVAQGSIEEGMLQVLSFRKALFAGVLDGGSGEVFLQGTRLSKFMDSVEQVTGATGPAEEPPAAEATEVQPQPQELATEPPQPAEPRAADARAPLPDAGLSLVAELARRGDDTSTPAVPWIERDPAAGRECLKLPRPEPATLERVAQALGTLAAALRR
jgi:hypothetical protein